jgi:hypothetical protein
MVTTHSPQPQITRIRSGGHADLPAIARANRIDRVPRIDPLELAAVAITAS